MPNEMYMLKVNCSHCRAEAWLHDVPVSRVEEGKCMLESRPVHEYLLPGTNKLQSVVNAGLNPSKPLEASPRFEAGAKTFATVELMRGPAGVFSDDPAVEVLSRLEWRPVAGSMVEPPVVRATAVALPAWLPRWSWVDASVMTMSANMEAYVFRLLQHLAASLGRGDTSLYSRAADPKFREVGMAYGIGEDEARQNFLEQWGRVSVKAEFAMMTPVRRGQGGRLIECLDAAFEPVVRAVARRDGVVPLRFPILLAAFGNEMRIVR